MKTYTILIVCLVALTGVFLKLNKHLVLKIPKVGFILHAMLGGPLPGYLSTETWERQDEWLGKGDVVVAITAKSGTTWMLATVYSMLMKGNVQEATYPDIISELPWPEFIQYPGQAVEERIKWYLDTKKRHENNWAAYKSHQNPPAIKVRPGIKYIVGVRDPAEIVSSFITFFDEHSPEFCALWGGFPTQNVPVKEMIKILLDDKGDGNGGLMDDLFFAFVKGWWPYRKHPNVHFVTYKNRLKDPVKDIDDLDQFLGTKLTAVEKAKVIKTSDISFMKKVNNKFSLCALPKHPFCVLKPEGLVKVGGARNAQSELPKEDFQRLIARCEKEFGVPICNFIRFGGDMPDMPLPGIPDVPVLNF